jgi:hypothetical protein
MDDSVADAGEQVFFLRTSHAQFTMESGIPRSLMRPVMPLRETTKAGPSELLGPAFV